MYHVVWFTMQYAIQAHLRECGDEWEWLGEFGLRWFTGAGGEENTVVMSYMDVAHWNLFVVEENRTYHLGSMLKIHNSVVVDNFFTLMHIAYAASRGWLPSTL
jgi:hypothetical protein